MLMIGSNELGGGFVRTAFTDSGERLKPGTPLSAEKINAWPNKRTLIERGMIAVYPPSGATGGKDGERHIAHRGGGQYDVFVGHKLNERPLTKDEAEELATRPAL